MASTTRASHWSVIINNPNADDRSALQNPPPWVRYLKGQDEVGHETGTLHINMYLHTDQLRRSTVSKWLRRGCISALLSQDHIRNWKDKYAQKEDTAVPGTQFERNLRDKAKQLTMAERLTELAAHHWDNERQRRWMVQHETEYIKGGHEAIWKLEYWEAVNNVLENDDTDTALYAMPQYEKMYVKCRNLWVKKYQELIVETAPEVFEEGDQEDEMEQTDRQLNQII